MLDESQSTLTASSIIVTKPAYACFKVAASTLAISSSPAYKQTRTIEYLECWFYNLQLVQNQTILRVKTTLPSLEINHHGPGIDSIAHPLIKQPG